MGKRLQDQILAILQREERGLTVKEIHAALEEMGAPAKTGPLRGRLTELRHSGVVEKAGLGAYRLVRTDPPSSYAVEEVAGFLSGQLSPTELARTVIWDATPYLMLSEDGVSGRQVVVETPVGKTLVPIINQEFETRKLHGAWLAPRWRNRAGPLGPILLEPQDRDAWHDFTGILVVAEERIGGTGLTRQGFRAPFPERILMEFMAMDADVDVGRAIVEHILRTGIDIKRGWACAHAINVLPDYAALMASIYHRLSPSQRQQVRDLLPGVICSFLGEGQ